MAKTDIPKPERLLEISPGMAIWRVHLDSLRERDLNARVMEDEKFRRLSENIKKGGELESFPLVTPIKDRDEFTIISGHHRTRAARFAHVMVIPVIVIERELTEDEIKAKQLAHNALAGYDDNDVLRELYQSIEDLDQRLATGLSEMELKAQEPAIPSPEIGVEFEFEPVYILFMESGHKKFQEMLDRLEPEAAVYAADKADFDAYVKMVNQVSKKEGVRNIAGIMAKVIDIVEGHYKKKK